MKALKIKLLLAILRIFGVSVCYKMKINFRDGLLGIPSGQTTCIIRDNEVLYSDKNMVMIRSGVHLVP